MNRKQYTRRATEVIAEQYQPGLEDGVLARRTEQDEHMEPIDFADAQYREFQAKIDHHNVIPYISTINGPLMCEADSWIVTSPMDGERYLVPNDLFDLQYEESELQEKLVVATH